MFQMKLELIPVAVTDVDRAKRFYVDQLGFRLDHDMRPADYGVDVPATVRSLQVTPPGSACSLLIVNHFPEAELPAGSAFGLHLCVDDIDVARHHLSAQGIEVGEVVELAGAKHAVFRDPDGNEFWFQQKPTDQG